MIRSYSVDEARAALPEVINEAKKGKVIEITRRGKPEAVVISLKEYQRLTEPRPTFLTLYREWRETLKPGDLDFDPAFFESLRDRSPGRSFAGLRGESWKK